MFAETYTKFYVFVVLALVVGFLGMEVATSGITWGEGPTGMVSAADAHSLTSTASPGANLLFLFIGVVAGAIIVGTAVYIYNIEKKQYY